MISPIFVARQGTANLPNLSIILPVASFDVSVFLRPYNYLAWWGVCVRVCVGKYTSSLAF